MPSLPGNFKNLWDPVDFGKSTVVQGGPSEIQMQAKKLIKQGCWAQTQA